jgi:hypothetical protein
MRRIIAVSLAALIGCSDSTGPGDPGTITFTFAGGTFTVTGVAPAAGSTPPENTSATAGSVDAVAGHTAILGLKALGNDHHDLLHIAIHRNTVGTSPVDAECDPSPESSDCTGMIFAPSFDDETATYTVCTLESGTFTITELSSGRIKGTFSGSGACVIYSGGEPLYTLFTVTNGTFNVGRVAPSFNP